MKIGDDDDADFNGDGVDGDDGDVVDNDSRNTMTKTMMEDDEQHS